MRNGADSQEPSCHHSPVMIRMTHWYVCALAELVNWRIGMGRLEIVGRSGLVRKKQLFKVVPFDETANYGLGGEMDRLHERPGWNNFC